METKIVDNAEEHRYELWLDDEQIGLCEYIPQGEKVILPHTEISSGHGGEGHGGRLVQHTLDDLRKQGKKIVPSCSFVAGWISHNPTYRDMLA